MVVRNENSYRHASTKGNTATASKVFAQKGDESAQVSE
jgi:hypothetical protein